MSKKIELTSIVDVFNICCNFGDLLRKPWNIKKDHQCLEHTKIYINIVSSIQYYTSDN